MDVVVDGGRRVNVAVVAEGRRGRRGGGGGCCKLMFMVVMWMFVMQVRIQL